MPWTDMIDRISTPNATDCMIVLMVVPSPTDAYHASRPINQDGDRPTASGSRAPGSAAEWLRALASASLPRDHKNAVPPVLPPMQPALTHPTK